MDQRLPLATLMQRTSLVSTCMSGVLMAPVVGADPIRLISQTAGKTKCSTTCSSQPYTKSQKKAASQISASFPTSYLPSAAAFLPPPLPLSALEASDVVAVCKAASKYVPVNSAAACAEWAHSMCLPRNVYIYRDDTLHPYLYISIYVCVCSR